MDSNFVKTDGEIRNRYFIKGATVKVTKGPKQARSWNKLFVRKHPAAIYGVPGTDDGPTVQHLRGAGFVE